MVGYIEIMLQKQIQHLTWMIGLHVKNVLIRILKTLIWPSHFQKEHTNQRFLKN